MYEWRRWSRPRLREWAEPIAAVRLCAVQALRSAVTDCNVDARGSSAVKEAQMASRRKARIRAARMEEHRHACSHSALHRSPRGESTVGTVDPSGVCTQKSRANYPCC